MPIHEKIPPFNFLLVESLRKVRKNALPDAKTSIDVQTVLKRTVIFLGGGNGSGMGDQN